MLGSGTGKQSSGLMDLLARGTIEPWHAIFGRTDHQTLKSLLFVLLLLIGVAMTFQACA